MFKTPERLRKYSREWKKANPEKSREYKRSYKKAHPERVAISRKKSFIANGKAWAENENRERRSDSRKVSVEYIKRLIGKQFKITARRITPEMIELKRVQIKMKRTLKEFKKWEEENEYTNNRNV